MKKNNNVKGFFVIETIVVIAIVALVITYVFINFSNTYNRFILSESYNNLNSTNAALNLKNYVETTDVDYLVSLDDRSYVELSSISKVSTDYYKKLKNYLNIKTAYLINTDLFYADPNNMNSFDAKFKNYLETLTKVKSKYILVVELLNSNYGYMSVYNYNLELVGDPDNEYVAYVENGVTFEDPGYTAEDKDGNRLDAYVTGFVDTSISGVYYLTYTLHDITIRRKVVVYDDVFDFNYTGNYQVFRAPISGKYKIELWGAQGVGTTDASKGVSLGGKGAYTTGNIYLNADQTLYIYVGQGGLDVTSVNVGTASIYLESFNGGGAGAFDTSEAATVGEHGFPGGGATDIRFVNGAWNDVNSLRSRIVVAAGGGGGGWSGNGSADQYYAGGGGAGGALNGFAPTGAGSSTVGTQTSGFGFGVGGLGRFGSPNNNGTGGGGGGYYGGDSGLSFAKPNASGSGGSSFISGHSGVNAINALGVHTGTNRHYSGYILYSTSMLDGSQTFLNPSGVNETGHTGNGYARISLIDPDDNNTLSNVRYIYNEVNGSTSNPGAHWVELQAYDKNGNNISQGLTSILSSAGVNVNRLTDGNTDTSSWVDGGYGVSYVLLDLGQEYDLSSIRLWHYYGDGRTYNGNIIKVAGTNEDYITVSSDSYVETSYGKMIRPESLN